MDPKQRFKQLKERAKQASINNRKVVTEESKRTKKEISAADERAKDRAAFELAKLEAIENGEDFERKRAWDWTIEESEMWDEKLAAKTNAEKPAKFSDYAASAEKSYLNDRKNVEADVKKYEENKKKNPGEKLNFNERPSKESIDKLVNHLKKGDEYRMKRKRENDEEGVSFINDKNKRFNEKLSKHYDKYTKDFKDSVERGSAI